MGMNASAHLAYGYDLGSEDDFKAAERSEYGSPKLPWYDPEEDDEDDSEPTGEFSELAMRVLLDSIGFTERWAEGTGYFDRERAAEKQLGVEFTFSGSSEYPGWLLVAKGSDRNVSWAEAMTLDPAELAADRPEWDARLAAALTALGITPTQDGSAWLVFPSYG